MLKFFFKTLFVGAVFFFAVQAPTTVWASHNTPPPTGGDGNNCSQSNPPSIQTLIRLNPTTIYTNSRYNVIVSVKNTGRCDINITQRQTPEGWVAGEWNLQLQSTSNGGQELRPSEPALLRAGETFEFETRFNNKNERPNQGVLLSGSTAERREDFIAQVRLASTFGSFDGGRATTSFTPVNGPCTNAEIAQVLTPSFTLWPSSATIQTGNSIIVTPSLKNTSSATVARACDLPTGLQRYSFAVKDKTRGTTIGGSSGDRNTIRSQQTVTFSPINVLMTSKGVKNIIIDAVWYPADNSSVQLKASNQIAVTVTDAIPSVTTASAASAITPISATVSGNVTFDGGNAVTERGVLYSSSATNPVFNGTGVIKVTTTGTTGAFSVSLTGLAKSTKYYARAYAINAIGSAYAPQIINFTTPTNFRNCTYADKGTLVPTLTLPATNVPINSTYQFAVTVKNNSQGIRTCIWAAAEYKVWLMAVTGTNLDTTLFSSSLAQKPAMNSQETLDLGSFNNIGSGNTVGIKNIYVEVDYWPNASGLESAWSHSARQAITFSNPNCSAGQGSITGALSASPNNFAFTGTGATTSAPTITYSANITNGPGCILTAGRTIALSVTFNGVAKTKTYTLASNLAQGASLSIPGGSELAFPNNLNLIGVYGASARTATLDGTSAVTLTDASVSAKCPVGNGTSGDCAVDPQVTYGVANNGYSKAGGVMPAGTCGKSACLSIKNISAAGTTWNNTYTFVSTNAAWAATAGAISSTVAPGATASVGVDLTLPNTPGATSTTTWNFKKGAAVLSSTAFGSQTVKITCATSVTDCAAFISQTNPPETARLDPIPFTVVMKNLGSASWDSTYELVPSDVQAPPVVVSPPTTAFQKAVDGSVGTGTISISSTERQNGSFQTYGTSVGPTESARTIPKNILNNKSQFTIDFWYKGAGTVLGDDMYAQKNGSFGIVPDTTSLSYDIKGVLTEGPHYYRYTYPQTPNADTFVDGPIVPEYNDGQWHHMVITYKANNFFKMYIDNALYSSHATSGTFSLGGNLLIGQQKNQYASNCRRRVVAGIRYGQYVYRMQDNPCPTYSSSYFNGEIDEFKIYDSVLSGGTLAATLAKSSGSTAYNEDATFAGSVVAPAVRGGYTFTWKVVKRGGTPSITPNPSASTPVTVKAGDLTPNVSISSTGFARATEYIYEGDSVTVSFTGNSSSVGKIIRSSRAASKKFTAASQTKTFPSTGKYTNVINPIKFSLGTVTIPDTSATNQLSTGTNVPTYEIRICRETQASCP